MNRQITERERTYLRELAKRQAEIAALPVMAERKAMWYALNDGGAAARPPVIIETHTFDRDFLPDGVFKCESEPARRVERQLLTNLRNHELIDDDKVIPGTFEVRWFVDIDHYGVAIGRESVPDAQGVVTGYRFLHPIKDLRTDLAKLQPPVCRVDRERTRAWQGFCEELLGDILPVELSGVGFTSVMLTNQVIQLMGMEAFFLAMYDCPDELHQLMAYLRDGALSVMKWAEAEGLLRVNNGNQASFGSSLNFTERLPADGYAGPPARLCDMWGCANSQETVGVSPELFHEFCFPYYRDACEPVGLLYYGCCEPAHPFWDDIRRLPHLKKVSISRWCDERFMGEALAGTGVIYSRKPDPNFLSVDESLSEDAWATHIRETLEAAPNAAMEFIIRDVYTVHGNLENPRRAAEIARAEITKARG